MKTFEEYKRVIAIKEMSAGNDTVGSMWLETKTFSPDDPISLILDWAKDCPGKLIITIDETESNFFKNESRTI